MGVALDQPALQPSIQPRSVIDLIGNTPLLSFKRITAHLPESVRVYAKAEWYNPGGSVKDRPALNMVLDGEAKGLLTPEKTLVDATSGNTGIAYAMICAERGYKVKLALPQNASMERKQCLRAYGVDLVLTDPTESTDGAQKYVKQLVQEHPDEYYYPDQYNNDANWQAHYNTTGPEIWQQTAGRITHFVTGLGTTGTFCGVTRRLKELNPGVRCISMQPDWELHALEGLKHMPSSLVPGIYDRSLADEEVEAGSEAAQEMCRRLAREEGLLVGISAGANMLSALQVAEKLKEGVVVTIFCDSASKYLSEGFWSSTLTEAENWP